MMSKRLMTNVMLLAAIGMAGVIVGEGFAASYSWMQTVGFALFTMSMGFSAGYAMCKEAKEKKQSP